jgi:hypothetical protein
METIETMLRAMSGIAASFLWLWNPLLSSKEHSLPKPPRRMQKLTQLTQQWGYDAAWLPRSSSSRYSSAYSLLLTKQTVVLQLPAENMMVALDRRTGRELWRRVPPPKAPPKAPLSPAGLIVAAGAGDILIEPLEDGGDVKMQALVGDTGRTLWSGPEGLYFLEAYEGLIAALRDEKGEVTWLDANTGHIVVPETPEGKARFEQAGKRLKREGGNTTLAARTTTSPFTSRFELRLLDFGTGATKRMRRRGIENFWLGNHLVRQISGDSGEAGASLRPLFVEGYDDRGQPLWQYPSHIPTNDIGIAGPNTQVHTVLSIPKAKIIAVERSGFPGWIGLDAATGAALWHQRDGADWTIATQGRSDDFWVLGGAHKEVHNKVTEQTEKYATLRCYDAYTGQVRIRASLPYSLAFAVDERSIVTIGADGRLRCYLRRDQDNL